MKVERWGPIALVLVIVAMTTGIVLKYGPVICEEDPTFCEDQGPGYTPTLLPVVGLVGGVVVILGAIRLTELTQKNRKDKP